MPEKLVQQTTDDLDLMEASIAEDMMQFLTDVITARGMWRCNRKLVESAELPEPYRTLWLEGEYSHEPTERAFTNATNLDALRKHFRDEYVIRAQKRAASDTPAKGAIASEPERPEWLEDAPTTRYTLEVWQDVDGAGQVVQEVEITLDEYDKLRSHLARLRGVPLPEGFED